MSYIPDIFNSNYIAEVDQVDKEEWIQLLKGFDDATIYQTWSYGAVRWGENNLSHLVLKKDGEVLSIAQSVIKSLPIIRRGIAYIPWGPIWKKKGKKSDPEIFSQMLRVLKEEYIDRKGLLLRIKPNVVEDNHDKIGSIMRSEGFRINETIHPYRTLIMDISPSLDELRKNLRQNWRNKLNRSEKNKLGVTIGTSDGLYKIFISLQKEMILRKQYKPGVDYYEFGEIQKKLPDSLKMIIFICEYEGEPVSSAICSAIGDMGIYLLGATGDKGLHLKGSYLLQWKIVQELKKRGFKRYDLGGINPDKNPGVYHFKSGLSGIDASHIGQYELSKSKLNTLMVDVGDKLKKNCQIKSFLG
ncbi:MAG: peptidoglycan bridge formation glycyltransferase FemA/FemB family protein [Candidatus Dadabacteria bacterium]|nr:peptidoglycan bridge formation glycyltransferase FemA/FemB family protein [Candidatus Dadabacteria bacterium]